MIEAAVQAGQAIEKLGILAGGGTLPVQLVEYCTQVGLAHHVIVLDGSEPSLTLTAGAYDRVSMTRVGEILRILKSTGCTHVCMIGRVKKPSFRRLVPDARGALLLPKVLGAVAQGDDAVLRVVIQEFEAEGFGVVGIHDVMAGLVPGPGVLGQVAPDEGAMSDIAYGFTVAKALGQLDVGQAVIVQDGVVIGVEAVEGTDALLQRCVPLLEDGDGGVLIKACKPQQERRADLPTIGPKTVAAAAAAGLYGLAVEAGRSLIVDEDMVRQQADQLGLFVVAQDVAGEQE